MQSQLLKNNFDLLRMIFAGVVFLVHAQELSDYQSLSFIVNLLSSSVAVKSFFVISGFLIFMSYEKSSSLSSYCAKRIRRIYPAYLFIVLLCTFLLFTLSSLEASQYFSMVLLKYLISNLTFLNFIQPTLPGVFELNKLATVNGALWTLKIEVMFYLSVPIFVWLFRRVGHFKVILVTYLCSFAYNQILLAIGESNKFPMLIELARQFPGQLTYFMTGACLYYFFSGLKHHLKSMALLSAALLAANKLIPLPISSHLLWGF